MIQMLLPVLAPILKNIVGNLFPDPAEAAKAEAQVLSELHKRESEIQSAVAGIIESEAKSEHWLTASWRPITMLTFLGMLVAWWFDFLPEHAYQRITPEMFDQFLNLLKIGIGGYIVSRGAEKFATIQSKK